VLSVGVVSRPSLARRVDSAVSVLGRISRLTSQFFSLLNEEISSAGCSE
jgi:hypothetical protein